MAYLTRNQVKTKLQNLFKELLVLVHDAIFAFAVRRGIVLQVVPSGTFQTFQAIGNREDLSGMIYNISPVKTPFQSMAGRDTADAVYTEWQTDALAAVDTANAVVEGDDATNDTIAPTTRIGNYCQTSDKVAQVTTIQDVAVKSAGQGRGKSEMAYQLVKRGKELKRDQEAILTQNQAAVAGTASVARKLRPLESWYATNTSRGAGGANGGALTAPTDGTQRNFSETLVKTVMQTCYNNGAEPSVLMVGPVTRVNCSSQLTGGATKQYRVEDKKLVATVVVYETDFGPLKIVPNRFQRDRTAHLIDPEFVAVGYLERPQSQNLAINGLTRRKQMWTTYTLIMKNEAAHGVIADLNTAIL